MKITTAHCGQFGHPEFVLEADENHVPSTYLKWAVETMEGMVAGGSVFRPGETVQIGWMWAEVQSYDATHLTLFEPDMKGMPIRWVPGITHTLRTTMLQLFMLDSVSLRDQMNTPSIMQSLIVCTHFAGPNVFLHRMEEPSGDDSGWFVGCMEEGHDHNDPANLRCVSVYEAFLRQRVIQGFISFPVGSMVTIHASERVKIMKDGKELSVVPGSFLDEWLHKRADRKIDE